MIDKVLCLISLCDLWELYLFLNSPALPTLGLLTYFTSLNPCPSAINYCKLGTPHGEPKAIDLVQHSQV